MNKHTEKDINADKKYRINSNSQKVQTFRKCVKERWTKELLNKQKIQTDIKTHTDRRAEDRIRINK